jgi:hypothetical protein
MGMRYGLPGWATPSTEPFSEQMARQEQFQPFAQYQAALGEMNPGLGQYARNSMAQNFTPSYAMYQAFGEPMGQAASFSDYLQGSGGGGVSQADMQNRMRLIASAGRNQGMVGGNVDPLQSQLYGSYYANDPEEERSKRLAQAELMSGSTSARMNPQLAQAMSSVVDRLYNNYIAGSPGATGAGNAGPGGFMDYYLKQRGLT